MRRSVKRLVALLAAATFSFPAIGQEMATPKSPANEFTRELREKAFDALWDQMDRRYSYFILKPDVDWAKLKGEFRPKASAAKTEGEFVQVLRNMLANLKDMHVWIQTPSGNIGVYNRGWKRNFNQRVVFSSLVDAIRIGDFAFVGRTADGFGCLMLTNQPAATEAKVAETIAAMDRLSEAPGFLVDLRSATGGNEALARKIAERFCKETVVYAASKYRKGTRDHGEFGPVYTRSVRGRDDAFTRPVVCLIGSGCISSGEGFAKMMKALPHCTLVGEPTRGSSGNPRPFQLPGMHISVWHSTWVDMLPNGEIVEGKGVLPDVAVDLPQSEYASADPTFDKAQEVLRTLVAKSPKPGRSSD